MEPLSHHVWVTRPGSDGAQRLSWGRTVEKKGCARCRVQGGARVLRLPGPACLA